MSSLPEIFDPLGLDHKTIIVTGASSGIGRATAIYLSRLKARCVLISRNEEALHGTLCQMDGKGHLVLPLDLCYPDRIEEAVKGAVKTTSSLSGLVHCAGFSRTLPLRNTSREDLADHMRIHVGAFLELCKGITRRDNCSPEGASIVAISSVTAINGVPALSSYSAAKGALVSLTRSLAVEFAPRKIRFNCICPGWVRTPMLEKTALLHSNKEEMMSRLESKHPLGLGKPEDIAAAAAFLLSDSSTWITGSVLTVDGGYSAQ